MGLNIKDKKILYELDNDSRQTNKQIAKKIGLSEHVVGNRIKQLERKGIIEQYLVKVNAPLLGYMHLKIFFRLHNITPVKQEEMISSLMTKKNIIWLCSLRGKFDLVISVQVKDITGFSALYDQLFQEWGDYILERNVAVLEDAYSFTKALFSPGKRKDAFSYGKREGKIIELDKIDFNLLKILNEKGREKLFEIGNQIRMSSDTVRYRINNLKKKGVITGFGVKTDFKKLGNRYYIIFLKLQNMNKKKYGKLETLAQTNKNILYFLKIIGDHDIELEAEVNNSNELDNIIKSLRDHFVTEIKNYEIIEVIKEYRLNYFPY